MNKKKVLFVGCNYDQLMYLKKISKSKYFIIGTDINKSAPAQKLCNKFVNISYYNKNDLFKLIKKYNFSSEDILFTASSHHAYEALAFCANKIGIPFPKLKNIQTCLDKKKFYDFCKNLNISVPKSIYLKKENYKKKILKKDIKYFLKSDYGKSPKYCFEILNGKKPQLPKKDFFFRKFFILQHNCPGNHYRINVIKKKFFIFYKINDKKCIFAQNIKLPSSIRKAILTINKKLELDEFITKYDIIIKNNKFVILDIGLDTPTRLKQLFLFHKIDFHKIYIDLYLEKKSPKFKTKIKKTTIDHTNFKKARFNTISFQNHMSKLYN